MRFDNAQTLRQAQRDNSKRAETNISATIRLST